jgi:predicted DNA-binding transcriptional regulator AlpA
MRADRAAAYLGMSTSRFQRMVDDGEMPKPIKMHSMVLWDRSELDDAVENWKDKRQGRKLNPMAADLGLEVEDDDED